MRKPFFVLVCLLCVLNCKGTSPEKPNTNTDVYIVYLGGKEHDDVERITNSHLDMLAQVVGSKEEASKAIVYSYKHGFSGFAAKLTESQAEQLEDLPDVIQVTRGGSYKLQTTRSFDYMDLAINSPNNLLQKTNMGDGIIIGVIDSGIWPESESFNDEGLGPIPSKWKGKCISGQEFDAEKHCNRKIIGAYWFVDGLYSLGPRVTLEQDEFLSARDGSLDGHGTSMASIAGGSQVGNVSYNGLGAGTARGAAPMARLAIYKACWRTNEDRTCAAVDVLSAFEQAAKDGVDVILAAFGVDDFPPGSMVSIYNGMGMGSLHAITKGIPVISPAGNSGPQAYTVSNTEAWLITVGSTTIDRSFPTPIILENNTTLLGKAAHNLANGFTELIFPYRHCKAIGDPTESRRKNNFSGGTVMCFCDSLDFRMDFTVNYLRKEGAAGIIYARHTNDRMYSSKIDHPFAVEVDYEVGTQIYKYMSSNKGRAKVKVEASQTIEGKAVPVKVAAFSSRGPISSSELSPAILKPDIVAPGVNIIAAVSGSEKNEEGGYGLMSGTSVSAAHVAGIVAMLRAIHPDWSPTALKSALMTTAKSSDENGFPLPAEGIPHKPANLFDMGSGLVSANLAADPGLVYDMSPSDYLDYICAMGFRRAAIDRFLKKTKSCHTKKRPNILNVNVPSITIPSLTNSTTLTRTVTNVGPVDSVYKAKIVPPMGTNVSVDPEVLVFDSANKKISFKVTVSVTKPVTMEYTFGSLVWTDGSRVVKTPIAVKTESFRACAGISC